MNITSIREGLNGDDVYKDFTKKFLPGFTQFYCSAQDLFCKTSYFLKT